jgi:phosphate transport system protein
MTRTILDRALQRLQQDLLDLGRHVERTILAAVSILKQRDLEGARRLIAADQRLNQARFAVESETLAVIATQQPMAGDLRTLAAILEIATELERMGDYAKGIAKITLKMGTEPFVKPLIDIPRMAEKACDMLQRALEAFVRRDVDLARAIPAEDDAMDALYNQIFRELITYIMADARLIERASYLIWVAHNLERVADRVINICERVVFTVTGEMLEMSGSGDATGSPGAPGD